MVGVTMLDLPANITVIINKSFELRFLYKVHIRIY